MAASGKTIGIFGGTFDPVHNGHLSIAKSFLKSEYIDSLWVFLNSAPPHKDENSDASYRQRLKMLEIAFEPIDNIIISDLEQRLLKPSYTIRTVLYLKQKFPDYSFYVCIGQDSLQSFTSWHRWEEIISHCKLLVAARQIEESDELPPKLLEQVRFVDHTPVSVSSTQIRHKISRKESFDYLVPPAVLRFIEQYNLYRTI